MANNKYDKFIAIIPARFASTRFPGKPLVEICGKSMIRRVYEQASTLFETVCVATDDERIFSHVSDFGGIAIMTSDKHKSGTDRCFEAYQKSNSKKEIIVNIQGDEPFIQASQLSTVCDCFDDPSTQIATLVKPFLPKDGIETLSNPNSPKVVINNNMEAMYFSRSIIPFKRGEAQSEWLNAHTYYKHIGLYAYRSDVLERITKLPQSPLEKTESLEQLRWLENGYRIKVGITNVETIGIDTPDDLIRAERFLSQNKSL